ncbi:hypothetical protein M0R72_05155 [Candidatus Pacearchaeota archaeon]|jgi:hypothetical protein|nr:hypothetical protein [Candidatus Pacearchaeota archaeon]
MAAITTILQSEILSDFVLPLLLIFFIVFAILEKTKLFGGDKKQLNALTSLVIALIFVGAVYPKIIVSNLILFFAVAIAALFVILLLWGFVYGGDDNGIKLEKWMKTFLGIGLGIAFIFALIWATGGWWDKILTFFSTSSGKAITTNVIFILTIIIALAVVLAGKGKKD